jgi:hypothetical protein
MRSVESAIKRGGGKHSQMDPDDRISEVSANCWQLGANEHVVARMPGNTGSETGCSNDYVRPVYRVEIVMGTKV